MSRYFYYHVIYIGMMNVMLFVPHILIQKRFDGAVSGLCLGLAIATVLSLVIIFCFRRFPQMGIAEVAYGYLGPVFAMPILVIAGLIWLSGGILGVYSFARTMGVFFNPEMNEYLFLILMVLACIFASSRATRTVQFACEILTLFCLPFLALLLFKAVTYREVDWDAMRVVAGYVHKTPNFQSTASSSFLMSGYMNLMVFNRLYPSDFKVKQVWLMPVLGVFFAFFTFFIPIGFHGTMAVGEYVYLWSETADSMLLKYGFVQRVLFIFLVLYSILSMMFVMNTFHAAMEFFKSCNPRHEHKVEEVPIPPVNWILCAVFGGLSVIYFAWANEERNQNVTEYWLIARFLCEIATMAVMIIAVVLARKGKRRIRPGSGARSGGPGASPEPGRGKRDEGAAAP